jgi:hypothetical protein
VNWMHLVQERDTLFHGVVVVVGWLVGWLDLTSLDQ